jgi:hypothetical protein
MNFYVFYLLRTLELFAQVSNATECTRVQTDIASILGWCAVNHMKIYVYLTSA